MSPSRTGVDPRIERTRAVVVDAAAELLAEEGFERITIDGIAEHSGVARSTIYRHWPDRADLLGQAFSVVCSIDDTPDHGELAADLRHKTTMLARGLTEESWGRMLPSLIGASAHDADLHRALKEFNERRRGEMLALLQRAVDRGEIPDDQDLVAAMERLVGPFFLRRLMTEQPLDDEFVERQVRMTCEQVGAPYSAPACDDGV